MVGELNRNKWNHLVVYNDVDTAVECCRIFIRYVYSIEKLSEACICLVS